MAADTKFTPGPWLVSAAQGGWNCVRSQSHEGPIICGPSGMNNDANWNLISAAPELYAALENLIDDCLIVAESLNDYPPCTQPALNRNDASRKLKQYAADCYAALAKARGEA